MSVETKKKTELKVIIIIIQIFLNYIKYLFLTGSILFSLAALLFIIVNINPHFSFEFIQYFSFVNPLYRTESFSMGTKEIMEIFSITALFLWVILAPIKFFLKKTLGVNFTLSLKLKIILFFSIISLIYSFALIFAVLDNSLIKGFYFVLIVFYIINIASTAGYFLLNTLLNKISTYQKKFQ